MTWTRRRQGWTLPCEAFCRFENQCAKCWNRAMQTGVISWRFGVCKCRQRLELVEPTIPKLIDIRIEHKQTHVMSCSWDGIKSKWRRHLSHCQMQSWSMISKFTSSSIGLWPTHYQHHDHLWSSMINNRQTTNSAPNMFEGFGFQLHSRRQSKADQIRRLGTIRWDMAHRRYKFRSTHSQTSDIITNQKSQAASKDWNGQKVL